MMDHQEDANAKIFFNNSGKEIQKIWIGKISERYDQVENIAVSFKINVIC